MYDASFLEKSYCHPLQPGDYYPLLVLGLEVALLASLVLGLVVSPLALVYLVASMVYLDMGKCHCSSFQPPPSATPKL